jgi:peptidoglycan/LPS O-acetylase OafA/YrhL
VGLIRVILAYSVVLGHSASVHGYFIVPANVAVTLFFIVSGFYMAMVLAEKYTGEHRIRQFYSNRVLRLYPTYIISFALMIGIQLYLHQKTHGEYTSPWQSEGAVLPWSVKLPLLVPNIALFGSDLPWIFHYGAKSGLHFSLGQDLPSVPDAVRLGRCLVIPPAWSIGLELWFYLLAPFLILWRTRSLAILAFISVAVRLGLEWYAPWSSYFFFPVNLCFFLWGMLMYRVYRSERYIRVATQPRARVVFVAVVAAIVFRQYIPFYRNYDWMLYILFGSALPFLFQASKNWRLDRWIGNLSYPIYLVHASALLMLKVGWGVDAGPAAILCSTIAALVLLVAVEQPLEKFRQRRSQLGAGRQRAKGYDSKDLQPLIPQLRQDV